MDIKKFYDYTIYSDGSVYNSKGKKISPRIRKGKCDIKLSINGIRRNFLMHRLMYKLFVEDFDMNDINLCVTAKDGDFLNMGKDNLVLIERKKLIQGEGHKISKITDEIADEIRSKYKGKPSSNQHFKETMSYNDIAKEYNITKGAVAQLIRNEYRNESNYKLK